MAISKDTKISLPRGKRAETMTHKDKMGFTTGLVGDLNATQGVKDVLQYVLNCVDQGIDISRRQAERIANALTIDGDRLISVEDAKDPEKIVRAAERYTAIVADASAYDRERADAAEKRVSGLDRGLDEIATEARVPREDIVGKTPEQKVNIIKGTVGLAFSRERFKKAVISALIAGIILTGAYGVGVTVQNANLRDEIVAAQMQNDGLKEVNELKALVEELKTKLGLKEEENAELKEQNKALLGSVNALTEENSELKETVKEQATTILELQAEIDEFEDLIGDIGNTEDLDAVAVLLASLVNMIDPNANVEAMTIEEAVDFVKNYIQTAQEDINKLTAKTEKDKQTIDTLNNVVSGLQIQVETLTVAGEEKDKLIGECFNEIEDRDNTIEEQNKIIVGYEEARLADQETIAALVAKNEEYVSIIDEQGNQIVVQAYEITKLKTENNELYYIITEKDGIIAVQGAEIEAYKQALNQNNNANQSGAGKVEDTTDKTPVTDGEVTEDDAPVQEGTGSLTGPSEDEEPGF